MNKAIFLLCFSMIFLTSCTNSAKIENVKKEEDIVEIRSDNMSSSSQESVPTQNSIHSDSANLYDSYSGEWINWNNPENEADGGVSLKITAESNKVTGNFSAWSKNYGRLADSDIAGEIQDDSCKMTFADDGRGHSGIILLRFGQEQITADISVQTQNTDFTFPSGTTVLLRKKVQSDSEPVPTEESSIPDTNAVSSDDDKEILFHGKPEGNASSIKLTYGMSYDDVVRLLGSIGENTVESPWEEYSNYTLINKKELWSSIQTEEDFNKQASLQKTLINSDMQYTFTFINQHNSTVLTSILIGTPVIGTTKNIKCGDPVDLLTDQYGAGYSLYSSDKYEIYEYKNTTGYVRFFIDPVTKLIAEWGIDIYSYKDYSDLKNKLDGILSH